MGFKYYEIYKENVVKIQSKTQELTLANTEKVSATNSLELVKTLTLEGKGFDLNHELPVVANEIVNAMPLYGISAQILPEVEGDSVKLNGIPITLNQAKYVHLNIKGTYVDYLAFKDFINNLKVRGLSINKISIVDSINFDIGVDMVGY